MLSDAEARDVLVMVAVFAMAAFAWCGWAQESPPSSWRIPLGVGAGIGLVLAVGAGIVTWRHWDAATAFTGPAQGKQFGVIVAIEVVLAGGGAVVLASTGRGAWISAWICAVIGVHFVPLGVFFGDRGLTVLAVLLVAVAVLAVGVARGRGLTPSALVGAGAGIVFLLFAARGVVTALSRGLL